MLLSFLIVTFTLTPALAQNQTVNQAPTEVNSQTPTQNQTTIRLQPDRLQLPDEEKPRAEGENPEDKKPTKLELVTTFRAMSVEDRILNSKMAGGILEANFDNEFTSYLSFSSSAAMLLMTGTYTNRYTSEGAPPTGVEIGKAYVDAHPVSWAAAQFGVLDIDFSTLTSTFFTQGFLGARGVLKAQGDSAEASLLASQSIPSSPTAEVKSSEEGINTTLSLVTLNVASNPKDTAALTLKANASYFKFDNLTSSAATDSKYLGNSTVPVGSQARFQYQFEGNEVAAQALWKASNRWKFDILGSRLVNQKAPEGKNEATLALMNITYAFNKMDLVTGGGPFMNESDTLPGSYTAGRFGNNNRFGYTLITRAEFTKQKTMVFGRFVQANQMESNRIYQADRQMLLFGVEAKYDIL